MKARNEASRYVWWHSSCQHFFFSPHTKAVFSIRTEDKRGPVAFSIRQLYQAAVEDRHHRPSPQSLVATDELRLSQCNCLLINSPITGSENPQLCCYTTYGRIDTMSLSFSHAFDAILSSTSALSGLLNTCWPKRGVKPRRHMRRRRKERRRQLQRAVRPLPSLRERSLTIPLDDAAQVHTRKSTTRSQLTHNQPQSNFFNKLPPELRMQVYSHVFADEQIPIVKDSRLRYVTWMPQTRSLMPLLLTCRRM